MTTEAAHGRILTAEDVSALCEGARFYSPAVGEASMSSVLSWTIDLLERNGPLRLVHPEEMPPETGCAALCVIGSGAALADVPPSGDEFVTAVRELERLTGYRIGAVYPLSAATVSALAPMAVASQLGVPFLDADGMGRTFALVQHTSMYLAGQSVAPLVICGATGEIVSISATAGARVEALLRPCVDALGGWAALAAYPGTVAEVRHGALPGTVSRLLSVGRLLREPTDPDVLITRLGGLTGCNRIARGRIVELEHLSRPSDVTIPAHPSSMVIDEMGERGRLLRLELRSEIVAVFADGLLSAATPDLICLVDPLCGKLSTLDSMAPGELVDVLVTPAEPIWYSAEGLTMVGPAFHGIPLDHPRQR